MTRKAAPAVARRLPVQARLYRQVADALEERIAAGEFRSGDRLPTERDLSAYYSVSRTCVREALLALEIAGLVSIRVGSGVFVTSPPSPERLKIEPAMDQVSLTEILDARLMFEPEICAEAAANAKAEDIARLSAALKRMRDEHRKAADTEYGDRDFHLAIAQACGNTIAQNLLQEIWDDVSAPLWQGIMSHIRTPILRLKWIEDHEAIIAAIELRDRRKARAAMRRHIEHVVESLTREDLL
jgi:GntR family uxuAB operon transcriptional repressor